MSYTCNNCKRHVDPTQTAHIVIRYHCTVCDDFDLCANCKDKDGHPHPMEKLGFALDKFALTNAQNLLHIVCTHAQACRDAKCHLPAPMSLRCQAMKRVQMHAKRCRIRRNVDNCSICKQLIELCSNHAKRCQETKCSIFPLFCSPVKHKIKQQQLQQRLQQLTINDDSASALDVE